SRESATRASSGAVVGAVGCSARVMRSAYRQPPTAHASRPGMRTPRHQSDAGAFAERSRRGGRRRGDPSSRPSEWGPPSRRSRQSSAPEAVALEAVAFLAVVFFAVVFFAAAVVFFAAVFLAAVFFAGAVFLAAAFFTVFLAGAFARFSASSSKPRS